MLTSYLTNVLIAFVTTVAIYETSACLNFSNEVPGRKQAWPFDVFML